MWTGPLVAWLYERIPRDSLFAEFSPLVRVAVITVALVVFTFLLGVLLAVLGITPLGPA